MIFEKSEGEREGNNHVFARDRGSDQNISHIKTFSSADIASCHQDESSSCQKKDRGLKVVE